jgi:hypothetical protein
MEPLQIHTLLVYSHYSIRSWYCFYILINSNTTERELRTEKGERRTEK